MAIIRYTEDATIRYAYLNIFPDQFKTEKEKKDESWIKNTMDYFANKAYSEYMKHRDTFVKNYDLMKGILSSADFYQSTDKEVKSFTDMLTSYEDLPLHIKHYSIMTTPVNELVGEISKRPDSYRIKAFDDDSKSEELKWKTELLTNYIVSEAKEKIIMKAAEQGVELPEEELEKMTQDQVQEEIDSYTSVAEKWANHTLTAIKASYNLKEMNEDCFRDLLISGREFYHIYEDNSKVGYNIEVANPKNTWFLTTPDRKYISDVTGRNRGAYAAGTVQVLEISEIIESCPDLTKEEIDHLRSALQDYGLINVRESNLYNGAQPGIDSITYDTYDPLVLQTRMMIESQMKENNDGLQDFLGLTSNVSSFGYKYVVITAYWASKAKIGKVTFLDEMENIQTVLVDDTYKKGTIPGEISIEWGWINQWYQGKKIGPDIYHVKPFKLLPYCPIIGTLHEVKNTEAKSLVDLMKPFQVIYNVAMNQLYELLGKEIGKVQLMSLRHVPIPKDGDAQDALDVWEAEARARGVVFVDDSPENLKSPSSFNQFTALDLTRTQEIQSRYTLAQQMKIECWELVGMSKQRMGAISASESATGTNTAMQQSYSQTEPLFVAHEYTTGQLYQAIIDASLYIESAKEETSLSYITSEGQSAFVKVNGAEIRFRDLWVFPTNRPEDTIMFNEIRALSQAIIQNGGSIYEIVELYTTKSQRELKKTFKDLKDKMEEQQNIANQQKQQQLDQQQKQFEMGLEQAELIRQSQEANQNHQNELDRINKKEVAAINALSRNENATQDLDNSGVADSLEVTNQLSAIDKANKDYNSTMAKISSDNSLKRAELSVKREALQVERDNQVNDLAIAKTNARGRETKAKK